MTSWTLRLGMNVFRSWTGPSVFTGRNSLLFRLTSPLVFGRLRTMWSLARSDAENVKWDGMPVPTRLAMMLMSGCRAVRIRRTFVVCVNRATCMTVLLILCGVITTKLVSLLMTTNRQGHGASACRAFGGGIIALVVIVPPKLLTRWKLQVVRLLQWALTLPMIYRRTLVVPPGPAMTGATRRGTFLQTSNLICPGLTSITWILLGAVCDSIEATRAPTYIDPFVLAVLVIRRRGTPVRPL